MEIVSTLEDPVYGNNFDARKYLDLFYGVDPKTQEIDKESKFLLTFLNNVFSSGRIKGESVIEIGAGPSIQHILPACENFEKIYLTDYFQENLQEIEKWLRNSSDAFDWSPYLKYVCTLQNNRSAPEDKAEKLRRKVSLMECDVTKSNPLQPKSLPLADCVISAGCLICACKTIKEFKMSLKNVISLLKPGGHLIICDYLEATYYLVEETKLSVLSIDEKTVKEAVAESGCELEEFTMFSDFHIPEEIFDCKNVFCLLACRV